MKKYYFFTKDKKETDRFESCDVADRYNTFQKNNSELGYRKNIACVVGGWLPLFYGDVKIRSVKDIKRIYEEGAGRIIIIDDDGFEYSWSEFEEKVIGFNGGTASKRVLVPISPEEIERQKALGIFDPAFPEWLPISHFEWKVITDNPIRLERYFSDSQGYEFYDESGVS